MGLDDEARRAADEAKAAQGALDRDKRTAMIRDGEARMRAAVAEWAKRIGRTYSLSGISFEEAHDSEYGTRPNHPDRLVARVAWDDVRLIAYFNLEPTSDRWAGAARTTHGLHVYLDRYQGGDPIEIRSTVDLGRALQASDRLRAALEPAREYFGVSISRSAEIIMFTVIGAVVLGLLLYVVIFLMMANLIRSGAVAIHGRPADAERLPRRGLMATTRRSRP